MSDIGKAAAATSSASGPAVSKGFWTRPLPWALARARLFRRRQLRTARSLPVTDPPPVIEPELAETAAAAQNGRAAIVSPLQELVAVRRARPPRQSFLAPPRAAALPSGAPPRNPGRRLTLAAARREIVRPAALGASPRRP